MPVSVVINTPDRCDSLERTLVALQEQRYSNFDRDRFAERALAGVEAGIAAGRGRCRYEPIAAPPRKQFFPYS